MISKSDKKNLLWIRHKMPPSVRRHVSAIRGEFSDTDIRSDYPYSGRVSASFRGFLMSKPIRLFDRFESSEIGLRVLKRNGIQHNLTSDFLVVFELLGDVIGAKGSSSIDGGIGADYRVVLASLLEGGFGVEVNISEHQTTNRFHVFQETTIGGSKAYRALLELLRFDWLHQTL